MDNVSFEVWIMLIVGVLAVWAWSRKKKSGTMGDRELTLKKRILMWFNAVDQQELANLERRLEVQRLEQSTRLDRLEIALRHQGRLEDWATDVNSRLCRLELSKDALPSKTIHQHAYSKSILCLGVRVTLTDQIWQEIGIVNPQDLPDSQINRFIQGPFCRNCLRSLVVQGSENGEKSVRLQCRYCSLAWREDSTIAPSLQGIKREIYEYLDTVYKNESRQ